MQTPFISIFLGSLFIAHAKIEVTRGSSSSFARSSQNACLAALPSVERALSIPGYLLQTLAHVESGRKNPLTSRFEPWPWTLNVRGKTYFYPSYAQALKELRTFYRAGIRNIDVGCMQLNVGHHGHLFTDLKYMLNPRRNIWYAGRFLKHLKNKTGSWWQGAGHYHSARGATRKKYLQKVHLTWRQLHKGHKSLSFHRPRMLIIHTSRTPPGAQYIRYLNTFSPMTPKKQKPASK